MDAKLDALEILLHDGQYEEVDHTEFVFKEHSIQEGEEKEEEEEVEEEGQEKESDKEFEEY